MQLDTDWFENFSHRWKVAKITVSRHKAYVIANFFFFFFNHFCVTKLCLQIFEHPRFICLSY